MKKLLLTVSALAALTLLAPTAGYAQGNDNNPEGHGYLGLYFDDGGTWVNCVSGVSILDHVFAYIVYLSPDLGTTRGFEAGITITAGAAFNTNITETFPTPTTDVGIKDGANGVYDFIAGFGSPWPLDPNNTILCTLDIFYLEASGQQLNFEFRPSTPSSHPTGDYPMVIRDDFNLNAVNLTASSAYNLQINSPTCEVVLPNENASWGEVKSLFR